MVVVTGAVEGFSVVVGTASVAGAPEIRLKAENRAPKTIRT